jgi:hypothetical protein
VPPDSECARADAACCPSRGRHRNEGRPSLPMVTHPRSPAIPSGAQDNGAPARVRFFRGDGNFVGLRRAVL